MRLQHGALIPNQFQEALQVGLVLMVRQEIQRLIEKLSLRTAGLQGGKIAADHLAFILR